MTKRSNKALLTTNTNWEAAEGWLGLGNHLEANDEPEKITLENRPPNRTNLIT